MQQKYEKKINRRRNHKKLVALFVFFFDVTLQDVWFTFTL